jgi:hypothetical protein
MAHSLTDLLKDINVNKKNIIRNSEDKKYPLYSVLKCLNGIDTLLLVNELNLRTGIEPAVAYDYLISIIPRKTRYNKWIKTQTNPDIDLIMEFYSYSRDKAVISLELLTPQQLTEIRNCYDISSSRKK